MEKLLNLHTPEARMRPLGSLDREVDAAWAAALAAGAAESFFEAAAHMSANYFAQEGYHRKAEAILRQGITAAAQTAPTKSRSLRIALANRLTQEQKLLAATVVLDGVLAELVGADAATVVTRVGATTQLAQIREERGEFEAAEALLRELKTLRAERGPAQGAPPGPAAPAPRWFHAARPAGMLLGFAGSTGNFVGSPELAGYYQRRGETAKAESLLKQEIEDARTPEQRGQAAQNYALFLQSQQRWEESVAQWEKIIAAPAASTDPRNQFMLMNARRSLAQALTQTGKADQGLEILRQSVAESTNDSFQRVEALRSLAQLLIQQKQWAEAEKVVEQIRHPIGQNAPEAAKHSQTIADLMLAEIRGAQSRHEEARAIRERLSAQSPSTNGDMRSVWRLLEPVQELLRQQKYDQAFAQVQTTLADAESSLRRNPEEIGAFSSLIFQLPPGRDGERLVLLRALLAVLDGVEPGDHPRVARALGQLAGVAAQAGLSATETARLFERQEKILIAAQGEDSPALNDMSRQRAQFYAVQNEPERAVAEMQAALRRTEAAAGPKSRPTIQVMRELMNFLPALADQWAEEEKMRLAVIERSSQFGGMDSTPVHDMSALAGRYFAHGQPELAVSWMDRAIESARGNSQMAGMVPQFERQRSQFLQAPRAEIRPQ